MFELPLEFCLYFTLPVCLFATSPVCYLTRCLLHLFATLVTTYLLPHLLATSLTRYLTCSLLHLFTISLFIILYQCNLSFLYLTICPTASSSSYTSLWQLIWVSIFYYGKTFNWHWKIGQSPHNLNFRSGKRTKCEHIIYVSISQMDANGAYSHPIIKIIRSK